MTLQVLRFVPVLLLVSVSAGIAVGDGGNAVFKSTDRGRSWVRSDQGIPDACRINAFVSSGNNLLAGTDEGVFISLDEARTWQPVTGAAMSSGRIVSFATVGNKVFAGTSNSGLLESTDHGKSWTSNATFLSKNVRCLLSHDGRLYVGTDKDGVWVSNRSDHTWSSLTQGFPIDAQVFALSMVEGRVFAGLYSQGLYGWSQDELRWLKSGTVSPLVLASTGGTLVAGHNPGGVHWSADMGATWSKATAKPDFQFPLDLTNDNGALSSSAPVWELAANEDLVIAGASDGIYISEDSGRTWSRARTGLPAESPGISFLLEENFFLVGTIIPR